MDRLNALNDVHLDDLNIDRLLFRVVLLVDQQLHEALKFSLVLDVVGERLENEEALLVVGHSNEHRLIDGRQQFARSLQTCRLGGHLTDQLEKEDHLNHHQNHRPEPDEQVDGLVEYVQFQLAIRVLVVCDRECLLSLERDHLTGDLSRKAGRGKEWAPQPVQAQMEKIVEAACDGEDQEQFDDH